MALTPEEQAELDALDAELSQEISPSMQNEPKSLTDTFVENFHPWDAVVNATKGTMALAEDVGKNPISMAGPFGYAAALGQSLYKDTPTLESKLQRTADLAGSAIPGLPIRTVGNEIGDFIANKTMGTPMRSQEEYTKMLAEDLSLAPAQMIGMAAAPVIKGAYQGARDVLAGAPPPDVVAAKSALRPGIMSETLGAGRTNAAGEVALAQDIAGKREAFIRTNPAQWIDPNDPQALTKLITNLDNVKTKAATVRNSIIQEASQLENMKAQAATAAGEQIQVGKKFQDIPLNETDPQTGITSGLDTIQQGMPGGEKFVPSAIRYVQEKFGIMPEGKLSNGAIDPYNPGNPRGRSLSASELQEVIHNLDGQIETWDGWDASTSQLPAGVNPGEAGTAVAAFKYLRFQINKLLNNHIAETLGPEKAEIFATEGQNYGMGREFSSLAKRTDTQIGKVFGPKDPNQIPSERPSTLTNAANKIPGKILPGTDQVSIQNQAMLQGQQIIGKLQQLVDMSVNPPKPLPRGWAQVKTSLSNLNNFTMLALTLGLIQKPEDLMKMPDDQGEKLMGIAAGIVPEAFVPTPDKINVVDGKFQDPFGKETVIQQSLDLAPQERALRIGATFANRYLPSTPMAPVQPPKPALPVTMEKLMGAFNEVPETSFDSSYDQSNTSQLEQLQKMTALHEKDIQ